MKRTALLMSNSGEVACSATKGLDSRARAATRKTKRILSQLDGKAVIENESINYGFSKQYLESTCF